MTHQFSQVPKAQIQRSSFNRSHTHKTTFNGGQLIPILCDEALPGDSFNLKLTAFARLATPIFPIMDNLYLDTHFFSVPVRLLWDNWEKFNGAQTNPGDSTDYQVPTVTTTTGWGNGTLSDHMGIPTEVPGLTVNALHHRAQALIWNEWFRDQNLQDSIPVPTNDGPDNPLAEHVNILQRRGKRHDYFTSALPWPQKGPGVELNLGTSAPIHTADTAEGDSVGIFSDFSQQNIDLNPVAGSFNIITNPSQTPDSLMYADLTEATSITINSLRQSFQIQKMYERDASGGTRYTEVILSHFLVSSPDARLQRPEYLGGGTTPINIKTVAQTQSSEPTTTPQGTLAGYGTGTIHGHGFNKSFTEHCILIGFISARADLTYQQGLDRMWSRSTRFDFYWPALAHLGEQEIKNKEIMAQGTPDDELVFGYQERYAEYRYKNSLITGKFRSNDSESLDAWHLSQDFGSLPTLNDTFIKDTPPINRVIAVPSEPHFLLDMYFDMRCARPMPLYGTPGNVDRF